MCVCVCECAWLCEVEEMEGKGGRAGNRPGLVSLPSFRARYVNRNANKVITFIFKSIIQNISLLLLLNLVNENICENYFFF